MIPPGLEHKVMHALLRIGDATIMASDGRCAGQAAFNGFALSIAAADNRQAEILFEALIDGGQVTMPIGETFFAHRFGMLTDRFGVGWMVIVPKQ
jgi:PhnB protein